jgi:addiction module RelE/StbE family toxin
MHKIRYTEQAEDDLCHIFKLIASDKPTVAIEYIGKLEQTIELLETNPEIGVECRSKNVDKDCRILIFENYLIFYRIEVEIIRIGRILSSRIDYQNKEILDSI